MADVETFVRFMRLVEIGREAGACWNWTGNRPDGRHGHFSVEGKTVKAHRWMHEAVIGPIGAGLVVRHKCDNPACVNPAHLEAGTFADNTRDMLERGRNPNRKGERHPLAKLTEADVLAIRQARVCGQTEKSLAERFGVARGQIHKIVNRINWKHVA